MTNKESIITFHKDGEASVVDDTSTLVHEFDLVLGLIHVLTLLDGHRSYTGLPVVLKVHSGILNTVQVTVSSVPGHPEGFFQHLHRHAKGIA